MGHRHYPRRQGDTAILESNNGVYLRILHFVCRCGKKFPERDINVDYVTGRKLSDKEVEEILG